MDVFFAGGGVLYVGCRVRILFVRNQVFQDLVDSTGTIVGRAMPADPFGPEDQGDWLVSCDVYGGTRCPRYTYAWDAANWQVRKVYPHFCPKSDQLKAIIDFDPASEALPEPEALVHA
ncbi:hypothetical protein LYSHEL_26660 [Lysobacter helvus]|uniref:Uncharacterized protein n=2 Tax=Lysobacteraceae TaxID=32033 RepID=A0ABN6FV99_9GAMM|nr:hypothetical protein LYSCAS_26650 [Lysobacter caseinilyticus]BCT96795.1 hypothetical protein LYSHEL_26660 [Lysobacter helvus]